MIVLIVIVLIGLFDCLLIYSAFSVSDEDKELEDEDQVEYLKRWREKRLSKKR